MEEEAPPSWRWRADDWLVATGSGVWMGRPGGTWARLGGCEVSLRCLLRGADEVVAGGESGLWQALAGEPVWRQLHDEVLTMVQDVARLPADADRGGAGLLAATAYGVHRARPGDHGDLRWRPVDTGWPTPGARFALQLMPLDDDGQRWAVATEDGLFVLALSGPEWQPTAVTGTAVRALIRGCRQLWAGTDAGGLWCSDDGERWQPVAGGPGADVLCLAELDDGRLLAGTPAGLCVGRPGDWRRCGPPLAVTSVAADGRDGGPWALGASPGGFWWSGDEGCTWTQAEGLPGGIGQILPP